MPYQEKQVLKRAEAFQSLNETEIDAIAEFSTTHSFSVGQRLFKDGDTAKNLWVIAEGMIDLRFELPERETSEANTISSAGKNQIIGWSSLIPPYTYKLSAYCADSTCKVLKIDAKQLLEYLRKYPALGYRVLKGMIRVVGKRFQQLQASAGQAPYAGAKVIVHMGTCGIAAGARNVMKALTEEKAKTTRQNIQVTSGGCLGLCQSEPNVTVDIDGEEAVVYQFMDEEKMHRIFTEHILGGRVQSDLVLERGQS